MYTCVLSIFAKHLSGKRRNHFFLLIKCVALYVQNKGLITCGNITIIVSLFEIFFWFLYDSQLHSINHFHKVRIVGTYMGIIKYPVQTQVRVPSSDCYVGIHFFVLSNTYCNIIFLGYLTIISVKKS